MAGQKMNGVDQKQKVLVVDDNPGLLQITARLLKAEGHQVLTGSNGNECIELARKHNPDLILLDNILPDINGSEVCKKLKGDPLTENMFIVIISASKTSENDRTEGLEAGADGYIVRPLGNRRLMAQIESMLRIKRSEEALRRNDALVSKEKERAEFYLDLLCHDLRNIHQGLSGALQLSRRNIDNREKLKVSLKIAQEAVDDSIELTKEVMLLSRIMKEEPVLDLTDIDQYIKMAFEQVQRMFPKKKIQFETDLKNERIFAEPLIKEIFINIFHNAVRLQDQTPLLRVMSYSDEDFVYIEISDRGPGIPDILKKDLFKRYGIKGEKTRTGLGLSIVNLLVKRYHGFIKVKDRIAGNHQQGACFEMRFPKP
jgi:DNA-binding response OmpR family regulator